MVTYPYAYMTYISCHHLQAWAGAHRGGRPSTACFALHSRYWATCEDEGSHASWKVLDFLSVNEWEPWKTLQLQHFRLVWNACFCCCVACWLLHGV